jgi:hypothetical protein
MAQIQWNPPVLDHQNCPNIGGKYKPNSNNNPYDYNQLLGEFLFMGSLYGVIDINYDKLKEIPFRSIDKPSIKFPGRKIEDYSEFLENAFILIKQSNNELVLLLMGGDGSLYQKVEINLNSTMLGCDNIDFVMRASFVRGGAEGTSRGVTALERRYRRLDDGRLQVTTIWRYWHYDPAFGLIGLNQNGSTNNTGSPKEERSAVIFAGVP